MTGFSGFLGAAPRGAGMQVFRTSGNFVVPEADWFIVDVFGGGGSGGATDYSVSGGVYSGGGGGARNRQLLSRNVLKPGVLMPITVGAGGAAISVASGTSAVGVNGGKSAFGHALLGVLLEAYGGCGTGSSNNGGGGVFSAGTSYGLGGNPCTAYTPVSGSGAVTSNIANACTDGGGASVIGFGGSIYLGGSTFGGGAAYSMGNANGGSGGNSLYAGAGGASGSGQAGFSGLFDNNGASFNRATDGVIGKLIGGGGNGGQSNFNGSNQTSSNGGFPAGGGGAVSVPNIFSGKGGDGLVIIYWW
ncbi:hypothetical protein H8L32_16825 [Undibacterium sp. CY18W]|uniref:Glycine rich protein n=1 Tax=Undibacterium hunanense TaxID=2762292 RepID=A0ABR6ZTI6_9BURK|nr:hypothetical protein [Undibacterium hunanense]MBC3919158.1 hypothetical protein [Undibacterium hunanense]